MFLLFTEVNAGEAGYLNLPYGIAEGVFPSILTSMYHVLRRVFTCCGYQFSDVNHTH